MEVAAHPPIDGIDCSISNGVRGVFRLTQRRATALQMMEVYGIAGLVVVSAVAGIRSLSAHIRPVHPSPTSGAVL